MGVNGVIELNGVMEQIINEVDKLDEKIEIDEADEEIEVNQKIELDE